MLFTGTLGIVVITGVMATIIGMDFPKTLKICRRSYRKLLKCKKNVKKMFTSKVSIDSVEHLYAEDFDDLNNMERETERTQLSRSNR